MLQFTASNATHAYRKYTDVVTSYRLKENGKVPNELYDDTARQIAGTLIKKSGNFITKGVTRGQMRRVFDEVKRIHKIIREKGQNKEIWDRMYPLVKLVKSKTAYTTARAKRDAKSFDQKAYENLYSFVAHGIDQVSTIEDFETFCLLFEAVYSSYYELGGAEKNS